MNASELLAMYERVTDASNAVRKLRRFVLDLAIRGKLVEQDMNDEPSGELLRRMIGKSLSMPEDSVEEPKPFELPHGWSWTRVGEVCSKTGSGSTPRGGQASYKRAGVPFLRSQNVYDDGLRLADVVYIDDATHARMSGTAVSPMDLLLNITGGSMGRCCLVPMGAGPANISQHVAIIRPAIDGMSAFMHCLVRSPYFQSFVVDEQTGAGRGGLPKNRMDRIAIPLPPLAEQQRIVAKVHELMALCDQLEAARTEREAARDRLAAASLARLNAPDPDTFNADARFALNVLPALSARPAQVKQLRQTILNLAVRGKLLPQDTGPHDPARRGSFARGEEEEAFEIPRSWRWVRLSELGTLRGGGTPSKARPDFWDGPIPWVSPKDMKRDYLDSAQMSVTTSALAGSAASLIPSGSVLFVVRGMILAHSFPVAISMVPLTINQDMKALVLAAPEQGEYLLRALKGLKPYMLKRVQRSSHGTCRLEASDYTAFAVPIPPLAEQRQIVAKVDELMGLCDQLEASLMVGESTRSSLLDALLHEAIEPSATVAT